VRPFPELQNIGRQPDGTAGAGNLFALKTGTYSRRLSERTELQAEIIEREQVIVTQLGGVDLSAVATQLVRRYVETTMIADALAENVFVQGPLTAKGRARAAVTLYLQVLDRQHRLAMALGLERRTKPVVDLARMFQKEGR
jgi:hypothetical protein